MAKAAERAHALIRAEIMSGALRPGEALPEEQLAALCGVSRTPVREAIQRLQGEGLVRQSAGRRSFVADWPLEHVMDSFELRALLEARAAARAAERLDSNGLTALAQINAALGAAVDSGDVPGFIAANRAFHDRILLAAGSDAIRRALTGVVEQPVILRTARQYSRAELRQSHREHDALLAAFRRRDPAQADAVMRAHIDRAARAYHAAFERARPDVAA